MAQILEPLRVCGWFKDGELMNSKGIYNLSAIANRKKVDDIAFATAILHNDDGYTLREGTLTFPEEFREPKKDETEIYLIVPRHTENIYIGFEPVFFYSWQEAEKRTFWKQEQIPQKIVQGIIEWFVPSGEVVHLAYIGRTTVKGMQPTDGWVYYFTGNCHLPNKVIAKKGELYRYKNGEWTKYKGYRAR